MRDDQEAIETREQTDEWFGDPREQSSQHPDANEEEDDVEPEREA